MAMNMAMAMAVRKMPERKVTERGVGFVARLVAHMLLIAGLAALAWVTVCFGIAVSAGKSSPAVATRFGDDNAIALAALARAELAAHPVIAERAARAALRRDATSASAAGVLGILQAQRGNIEGSAALIEYSQMLSRRDLPSHLWAIEAAVARNDIPTALYHYDAALRVGPNMPTVLFPVLATASEDAAIRKPLANMLRSRPPWGNSFIDYIGAKAPNVEASSQLLIDLLAAGARIQEAPISFVIQRLVEKGNIARAWNLYEAAHPGASRTGIRNGNFAKSPDVPTVFDWRLDAVEGASAVIVAGETGGQLQFEAGDGSGGVVARQRLVLLPGRYLLHVEPDESRTSTFQDSTVDVICSGSRQKIATVPLRDSVRREARNVAFSVAPGCDNQTVELGLYSNKSGGAIQGSLTAIGIRPLGSDAALH